MVLRHATRNGADGAVAMCGIAGVLVASGSSSQVSEDMLLAMSDRLVHRGPDGGGLWRAPDGTVGFAHRRLSILDLSDAGAQPMASDDGRYVTVFNGEIYNHLDLRAALENEIGPGAWRGHSDTETLLAGIGHWGLPETLRRAFGMFAIALWDVEARTLSLARDRMGEKPLYVARFDRTWAFASELPALRPVPGLPLSLDLRAISTQLGGGVVPDSSCVLDCVDKVRPGTILTIDGASGNGVTEPYETFLDLMTHGRARRTAGGRGSGTPQEKIESVLTEVVASQMLSDVPLGSFLSGGVDSSLVTALMQVASDRPVKTFSIGFADAGYDESLHAEAVAQHLGTEHRTFRLHEDDALQIVPDLASVYGEPFADSSQIPTLLLARHARKEVTVALTGDGGDEVFGGYNRYLFVPRLWARLSRIPRPLRRGARLTGSLLERAGGAQSALLRRFIRGLGLPASVIDKSARLGSIVATSENLQDIYAALTRQHDRPSDFLAAHALPLSRKYLDLPADLLPVEWMMAADTLDYLPSDVLTKVDRASMNASLETRAPFLDRRTVEAAWSLDLEDRVHSGQGKVVLRQILYRHVPQTLIERPKQGFAVPIDRWLRGPLYGWADALLDRSRLEAAQVLDPSSVAALWQEHNAGHKNRGQVLWSILMLQQWLERWTSMR